MKTILASRFVDIPKGVTCKVTGRTVTVTGPRGSLTRKFKDMVDIQIKGHKVKVEKWWGSKKELAAIRSICSHIGNMVTGVTKGFRYKMRFVYAHFPINATIDDTATILELRNFLGEKVVRRLVMLEGVTVARSAKVKDEIILEGNNLENVSLSAARIHQSCLVRHKDIRKFLDGIYVSEKGVINED